MSGKTEAGAAETALIAPAGPETGAQIIIPEASADETSTPPELKSGWVRHIETGTFHEVDDVGTVLAAYPGQYEKASKPAEGSRKIGWPKQD